MGLTSTIQSGVASAFNALGDLKKPMTLTRVNKREYDPETMQVNDDVETDSFEGLFVGYKQSEIDGDRILKEDQKLLIQASELTAAPNSDDRAVVTATLEEWDIVEVQSPPGDALHICQVRKTL